MSTPGGGSRFRLIAQNFEDMLRTSLDSLGWFDPGRDHSAVRLISESINPAEEIVPNLIGISPEHVSSQEIECGTNLEELRWEFYIDIFAESFALGLHLAGDIQDICKGKLPSIGRQRPDFSVLSLNASTPTHLFYCQLENVQFQRQKDISKAQNRYWWTVLVEVIDTYYDESDTP